ncbi:hypothetical protein NMP99_05460 [Glutamicibacter mishrai]|uniref:hypothetical protein n=1 Tax=Glutamicibacter mishrai TaxID=1775880 RepID=UPI0003B42A30|nr:hypothetical protein [Glutamicibacter mishrai]UTT40734.1 hypothetical protein NMP99_05460 [Glutamicibacter mishrai]
MAQANGFNLYMAAAICLGTATLASCSTAQPAPEPTAQTVVDIDADQLQKILEGYSKDDANATVINDKKLRSSIPQAQEWLESVKVDPSKCGVTFAEPVADQLQNSTMGAIEFDDSYLTVAVYKDPQLLKKQWEAKASANEQCSRYSVTSGSESRAFHLAKQPIDSQAEHDESYVVTSSDGKTTQQQLIVRSATANVLIGIQRTTAKGQTQQQLKDASAKINELLKELN